MEQWKQMVNHPKYSVSSLGRFKNEEGKILKPYLQVSGYLQMCLCENGKHFAIRCHREIAKAFLPNPENKRTVNHKDGDKTNNAVENLEWATQAENNQHSIVVLERPLPCTAKSVRCKETLQIYQSVREAARKNNTHHQAITTCCNSQGKSINGLHFEYV